MPNSLKGNPISRPLEDSDFGAFSATFSPDGHYIAAGGMMAGTKSTGGIGSTLRIWNTKGHQIVRSIEAGGFAVSSVAFSPDSRLIASAIRGIDGSAVQLWDLQGNQIGVPLNSADFVVFTPNGQRLISIKDDGVALWLVGLDSWLKHSCKQLRYHSALVKPTTEAAREAKATCEKFVWNHEGER